MAENVETPNEAAPPGDPGVVLTAPVDIIETESELLLLADMPGVLPGDVDVRYENGELTVLGRRRPPQYNGKPWLWEYGVGNYFRSFRISEKVASDKISAELRHGVLTVHLPKSEAAKPRKIAVQG